MGQTLAQVRASVRFHIDEPSANYWTDAELNSYIDARQRDLWRRILALRKDYWLSASGFTINLVAGQYAYTIADGVPSDIWRIETIRTTTSGYQDLRWTPGNPTSQGFIDGLRSDVPITSPFQIFYALRNLNTIWVSPLPQTAISAKCDYIQQPTVMSADTDTFLIPDPFMDYVEYMAAADALSKGPVGDSVGWQQKASDAWNFIRESLDTPRMDQGPDTVIGLFDSDGG